MDNRKLPQLAASKRILITGASGFLGHHLCASLARRHEVTGLYRSHAIEVEGIQKIRLDLENEAQIERAFEQARPEIVIHSAGSASPDHCEKHPDEAHAINVDLTGRVAELSKSSGAKLIHISTDHLFDGLKVFVDENEIPKPLNTYAATKALGEARALQSPSALVLRTNFYGPGTRWKKSFTDWVADSLRDRLAITLFNDVYCNPLHVTQLCEWLEALVAREATGIFNLAAHDRASKLEIGLGVARILNLPTETVIRASVESLNLPARRPKEMSLSTKKLEAFMGMHAPTIEEGLKLLSANQRIG